jgi:hypothetical protein
MKRSLASCLLQDHVRHRTGTSHRVTASVSESVPCDSESHTLPYLVVQWEVPCNMAPANRTGARHLSTASDPGTGTTVTGAGTGTRAIQASTGRFQVTEDRQPQA